MNVTPVLLEDFRSISDPGSLLKALHERFAGRLAIATAGQPTEAVLVALCVEAGFTPRIFTVDTGRLFPETLDHFDRLEKKYGVTIERFRADLREIESMVTEHGEFLFFDSKEKQELCCRVRKVIPNERALRTLDAWVTGLRADQSPARRGTPRVEIIERKEEGNTRFLLKAAPLVDWSEERIWDFVRTHDVPANELMTRKLPGGWRYESLGCILCTTPIGPFEARRAGRWRWFNKDDAKECGLHLPPPPHG